MKWLGSLLVLCSLCVFSVGCGGGSTEPAPDDEGTEASEDGGSEDTGTEDAGTEDAGTEDATE